MFSKLNFSNQIFHQIIALSFLLFRRGCFNFLIVNMGVQEEKGLYVKGLFWALTVVRILWFRRVTKKKTSFYATECGVGSLVSPPYHQNTSGEVDSGERTVSPSTSPARYYHLIRSIHCLSHFGATNTCSRYEHGHRSLIFELAITLN